MLKVTLNTYSEIGLRWVTNNPIHDKSTLGQVMAWCRQQQAITRAYVATDLDRHIVKYTISPHLVVGRILLSCLGMLPWFACVHKE